MNPTGPVTGTPARERFVLAGIRVLFAMVPLVVLLGALTVLVWASGRGLDLSDEGFYLLWADRPSAVTITTTQFGHWTGLLFTAAGERIAVFRASGILILAAAFGPLAFLLNRYTDRILESGGSRWDVLARHGVIVLASVFYYAHLGLLTPSYNWLALFGVTVGMSGLVWGALECRESDVAAGIRERRLLLAAAVLGVGGALTFLAKATSAAALAGLSLLWIVGSPLRRAAPRFTLYACGFSLLTLEFHIQIFEAGHAGFFDELRAGYTLATVKDTGRSVLSTVGRTYQNLAPGPSVVLGVIGWSWVAFLLPLLFLLNKRFKPSYRILVEIAASLAFMAVLIRSLHLGVWTGGMEGTAVGAGGAAILSITVLVVLASVAVASWAGSFTVDWRAARALLALSVLLAAGPFAVAVGTLGNVGVHASMSVAFFFAAALVFVRLLEALGSTWAPRVLTLGMAVVTIPALLGASANPYRLVRPWSEQDRRVAVSGSMLRVDPETAAYVDTLRESAVRSGWREGTVLLNLTGTSPAPAFLLGASVPGKPWLVGGHPGSEDHAVRVLARTPPERLERAWVLTAPAGRRAISGDILSRIGLDFPERYTVVAELTRPWGGERHVLWRPR